MAVSEGHASTAERLRGEILTLIAERGLVAGDQLPTEQVLSAHFGVSRATVREGLRLLEQDGSVRAVQGRGRFLSAVGDLRVERPVTRYESITDMLEGLGYSVTNAVLDLQEAAADETEAAALGIAVGDDVIRITRLRCGDERPLVVSVDTVPRHLLPGPIGHRDWSGSLTHALKIQGHEIVSSLARISSVMMPEGLADRFGLADYDPWLLVTETCMTVDGTRALFAKDYHRGEDIAFNVLRRA